MKIVDIVEADEFARQQVYDRDLLAHLFRIQCLRCRQFAIYFEHLSKKYPRLHWGYLTVDNLWYNTFREVYPYKLDLSDRALISVQESTKYDTLFNQLVVSKRIFEKEGGSYVGEEKLLRRQYSDV